MQAHSLLTLYRWIAARAAGQRVLVVGMGSGAGPCEVASKAREVIAYDRSRDIIGEASFAYGHVENLYFAHGDPFDAIREVREADVVVAIEISVTQEWLDQVARAADQASHPITVVKLVGALAHDPTDDFPYRAAIGIWGVEASTIGESPSRQEIGIEDWGGPLGSVVLASNQPIDQQWFASHRLTTPQDEVDSLNAFDEARVRDQALKAREAEIASILKSRIVCLALRLRRIAKGLRRTLRRKEEREVLHIPKATAALTNRARVEEGIRKLRPVKGATEGPLVSIVTLTHNGRRPLSRLLRGLEERTAYRSFEVIVVDNASTDDTASLLEGSAWSFPIRTIRNETNRSFSEGCNMGAEVAAGSLLLFLNNDVEPINDGWLGAMIESLTQDEAPRAVGALLIHPEIHPHLRSPFPVQHRGVDFRWRQGRPIGVHMGVGEDPLDASLRFDYTVPALTGACLLVRRGDFESVDGFTEDYVYGLEDIDFCLKMRDLGAEMRLCGYAALFHKESTTLRRKDQSLKEEKRVMNARLFDERWRALLTSSLLVDQLTGAGDWKSGQRTAHIVVPDDDMSDILPESIAAGLRSAGWAVEIGKTPNHLPSDLDLTVVMTGSFDPAVLRDGGPAIAWPIHGLEAVDEEWAEKFHAIAAVNQRVAEALQDKLNDEIVVLDPFVDVERFRPVEPVAALRCDWTVVAPYARDNPLRSILEKTPKERILIFGENWDHDPDAQPFSYGQIKGGEILPVLFSSAEIVVHSVSLDQDPSSSQILAALACGALVITDDAHASRSLLNGDLPAFDGSAVLRSLLDRYLSDPEARHNLTAKLRATILKEWNADEGVRRMISSLLDSVKAPP